MKNICRNCWDGGFETCPHKLKERRNKMGNVNLNEIAKAVTLEEGGKESVSVAQVKEIMNNLFTGYSLETVIEMWQKYNKR